MRRQKAFSCVLQLLILFILFILPAAGCRRGNAGADHPGYMDSAVRASNVRIKDSAAYFHVVDSLFDGLASPGVGDQWDYHYLRFCYYFYQAKRNSRAMQLADTLGRLSAMVQDESRRRQYMARSILTQGDVYQAQQLYSQAMDKFIAARQLIAPTSDSCSLAEYTHSLAIATFNRQHFSEALIYEKAMLAEQRACDDTTQFKSVEHLQGNLDNVGICYVRLGKGDSALEYFDAALQCIEAAGERFPQRKEFLMTARAVVEGNKADAFLLKGDTASAEKLLLRSIQINRGTGHEPEDALFSLLKLGRVYLRQTRLREAERVVQEIDSALPGVRTPELHLRWARLAFACDSAAGDWEHAAKAAQYVLRWQDSLAALAAKSDLVNMRMGLSVREKSARMPVLERQNTIRAWI